MVTTRSGGMAASTAPEESDSRISSVGRKRGSAQISQNPSTASSSTGEPFGASSRASRRSRKRAKKDNADIDYTADFDRKQRIELDPSKEQANAAPRNESVAADVVSWNKGVQPTLRTSFGGKAAKILKGSSALNTAGGAHKKENITVVEDVNVAPPSSEQQEITKPPNGSKSKISETKKAKIARLQTAMREAPLPKPTQKLNVGGDDGEVWVKYSLEHNPLPQDTKQNKIKHWIRREVQNRFVPRLLAYNVDILEKLDEDKIIEVLSAFISHQPAYDEFAKSEGHVIIGDNSFKGYCRNQLKAALNKRKETRKQHKGQDSAETENSFGKLVSSADVSNAVSDFEENEFEEDDEGDDMDISIVGSNESGEIEDDVTDASDSPRSEQPLSDDKASIAGKRSRADTEESHSPHPVDAAIESRLKGTSKSDPEPEFNITSTTPKAKNMPPIAGLPQQPLVVLAEVQKYYPGLSSNQTHCLACSEDGHSATFCPRLTCETCAVRGKHFTYACPQNIVCSRCREKGHRADDCQEKLARSVSDGVVCEICGSVKHIGDNCHLLWRTYEPEKMDVKKVSHMLIDCYSCGALNHFGTECGLRGSRMPYAGQTWTAENRERYLEGKNAGSKSFELRTKNGISIRGMARSDPVNISDDEADSFIRPKIAPPPQKQHLKFSDRVSMPIPPPPRNSNLPMYAQQPPPPPPPSQNWGVVQGNGAYRETFSGRGGMDYADDFRDNDDFHSFTGRDHDDLYRPSGRNDDPFRASGGGGGGGGRNGGGGARDPFPARQQPRNAGPSPNRGGRLPQNSGRGGGGRGRGGSSGGRGGGGRGPPSGGRGGRGGRR